MADYMYDNKAITFRFDWDPKKADANQLKHGLSFEEAKVAFADPLRIISRDGEHSKTEECYYCFGKVGGKIATVRFTWRGEVIRIIGAGFWREGKAFYEKENRL